MKILHLASEMAPFAKTGGLGDVLAALPAAQAASGLHVTVALPAYGHYDWRKAEATTAIERLPVALGGARHEVRVLELFVDGVRVLLIDHPAFSWRNGVYGDEHGEYGDNPFRFALYGKASLAAAEALLDWPDVLHGHDWHTGPAMVHAAQGGLPRPRIVFSIHNLAYRGIVPAEFVDHLSLPWEGFTADGFEFWGELCLLKAGLWAADAITTVSPRYAAEIQTPAFGEGLDGYLRARADRLFGIVNGVDYRIWSPEHDAYLAAPFSARDRAGKARCKAALQAELGLPIEPDLPLFAVVSRLTPQKGIDLLIDALPLVPNHRLQLVVVGAGDHSLLDRIDDARPFDVATRFGVDERLAHRVYAAADFFIMPSRFEPCGLGQLYAMAYGALPIVSPTGGLLDTVIDANSPTGEGCGIVLSRPTAGALQVGIKRALELYNTRHFDELQGRAMRRRFSWESSAAQYLRLYRGEPVR